MRTIGIMMTNFFGEYIAQIWPGVVRGAKERQVHLLIFPGYTATWSPGYLYQQSIVYSKIHPQTVDALIIVSGTFANRLDEAEYNCFFDQFRDVPGVSIGSRVPHKTTVRVDNVDGLEQLIRHVLSDHDRKNPAMISGPLTNEEARERLQVFRNTCESLGYSVSADQVYEGDFTIPSGHEAIRALFPEKKNSGYPDALICANDNMAFGAMRELKKLGYRVPEDVAVTGFDNVHEARFSFPSLSTISQSLDEQGYQAVLAAVDLIDGKSVPPEIILPSAVVLRSSCGCYCADDEGYACTVKKIETTLIPEKPGIQCDEKFRELLVAMFTGEEQTDRSRKVITAVFNAARAGKNSEATLNRLGEHLHSLISEGKTVRPWVSLISLMNIYLQKNTTVGRKTHETAVFLGECLQVVISMLRVEQGSSEFHLAGQITSMRTYLADIGSALTIEDISEATRLHLEALGVKSFYIAVYDKPVTHRKEEPWTEPEGAQLIIGYHNGTNIAKSKRSTRIRRGQLLPYAYAAGKKPRSMIVCSLYFRDEIIGFMMIDQTDITREIYDILAGNVSASLKTAALFKAREESEQKLLEVLHQLEQSNTQLQKISEIDELTGLYNRRGFLNLARRSMELAGQMGRGGLVFYADLDGLKRINDVHGHKAGDLAIKTAALILRKTFRNMDVVARIGGDEFTVLALDTDKQFIPVFRKRMEVLQAGENKTLGKPWKVSISIGAAPYNPGEAVPLEKLMTLADADLYREKQLKKKNA